MGWLLCAAVALAALAISVLCHRAANGLRAVESAATTVAARRNAPEDDLAQDRRAEIAKLDRGRCTAAYIAVVVPMAYLVILLVAETQVWLALLILGTFGIGCVGLWLALHGRVKDGLDA